MGRTYESIDESLREWLDQQHMFFVATAPMAGEGHVNLSPKGGQGTFCVLGNNRVAYLDLLGSGIETVAHLRENGRITFMFCAFEGPPRIVRLHSRGRVVQRGESGFDELVAEFDTPGHVLNSLRSVIVADVERIGDSCGFVVPRMDFVEDRQQLFSWSATLASEKDAYIAANNVLSIDALPALDDPQNVDEAAKTRRSATGRKI